MSSMRLEILNPVGARSAGETTVESARPERGGQRVVGLLNNSKPNVAHFLAAIEKDIRARGYRTVNVVKPRSAGACPDLEGLAHRCEYVINAVAD